MLKIKDKINDNEIAQKMCILGRPILFSPVITSIHFSVIAITLHPKPSIHFKKGVDFDMNNN